MISYTVTIRRRGRIVKSYDPSVPMETVNTEYKKMVEVAAAEHYRKRYAPSHHELAEFVAQWCILLEKNNE